MKLKLKCGRESLISEESFEKVSEFIWSYNNGYAYRDVVNIDGSRTRLYLHREIADAPSGLVVDHINGDPLDNRLENLRVCTTSDNLRNRAKPKHAKLSVFKGVRPRCGNFEASIGRTFGDHEYLGVYRTELDAAIAYNLAATRKYGEFARLNEIPFNYSEYTPQRVVGSSKHRGVSFSTTAGKWIAKIQVNKKRRHLGYFDSEESAALAYNSAAVEVLGEKAKLNVIA